MPMKQQAEKLFLETYDEHADAIYRFCYFRLFHREKAEEVAQEAFTRTWEYLAEGKEVENIRAFVYRVAKNIITDYFRKKKESSLDELLEQGFDTSLEDHTRWSDILDGANVIRVINGLDEKYREALILRYVNDLPVKEIAGLLDETENAVSVHLHRGLKQVKEILRRPPENGALPPVRKDS